MKKMSSGSVDHVPQYETLPSILLYIVHPGVATCIDYLSYVSLSGIYHLSLYGEDPWGPSGEGRTSTYMYVYMSITILYLISVISLHTCVFLSVQDTSTQ